MTANADSSPAARGQNDMVQNVCQKNKWSCRFAAPAKHENGRDRTNPFNFSVGLAYFRGRIYDLAMQTSCILHSLAMRSFSAFVEWDPESKLYVGVVPGVPGAHTQAASLDELRTNLIEVLELCLEEYRDSIDDLPHFVGIQQIEVAL